MLVPNLGGRGYWHQMGVEFTDPDTTASEAAVKAGLDYTITKRPLQTRNSKGHPITIPSHFAVMSDSPFDPDVIAIVGREFEPVQNMDLAALLDAAKLTGPEGRYSVDVAGKTADGRTVFWALKARAATSIKGDEYRDHWLIADGKDGNRALTMALTPVRHVCSNALAMAVAGASIKVGIQHTKAAGDQLKWWLGIAPQLDDAAKKAHDTLKAMGERMVKAKDVAAILEAAYPAPKVRGKAQLYAHLDGLDLSDDAALDVTRAMGASATELQRVTIKREQAKALFESYAADPDERNIAGTLLGLVNAVADCENHRQPTNAKELVAVSNLYGQRYQAQANSIKAALKLI
jgi:hypothetical protein